jgi:hypothetical protein
VILEMMKNPATLSSIEGTCMRPMIRAGKTTEKSFDAGPSRSCQSPSQFDLNPHAPTNSATALARSQKIFAEVSPPNLLTKTGY